MDKTRQAKLLIDALASDDIWPGDLVWEDENGEIPMWSSSGVNYATQEQSWNRVAKANGFSLDDIARIMFRGGPNPGIEGLYELTKNELLFEDTDYHGAKETDQLAVSYFYGGQERIKHWEANVQVTPEVFMSSLGWMFTTGCEMSEDGLSLTFNPVNQKVEMCEGGPDELIQLMWRAGWDIEEDTISKAPLVVWTCHGRSYHNSVKRILDR